MDTFVYIKTTSMKNLLFKRDLHKESVEALTALINTTDTRCKGANITSRWYATTFWEEAQLQQQLFSQSFGIDLNSRMITSSHEFSTFFRFFQEKWAAYLKVYFDPFSSGSKGKHLYNIEKAKAVLIMGFKCAYTDKCVQAQADIFI